MSVTPEAITEAYRRLALAVLARAVKDVRDGNGHAREARCWLAGPGASLAEMALDIPPGKVRRWAHAGK